MQTSEQGLALIRQSEGYSPTLYLCPAGKPTIGYGHVIRSGEAFPQGITEAQAEDILRNDVSETEQALSRLVTVPLHQNQFDALVVFAYNIGIGAFEKSTLLRLLNEGDTDGAAAEFGRWVYANGQRLEGLVKRRAAEEALFSTAPASVRVTN